MEIKITPFILFLILLITLVISMLFGNSFLFRQEGFVSYGYTNTDIMKVHIPQYSADTDRKVIYLYDNLYFDGKNGNLIEVDSKFCGNVRVQGGSCINGNIDCNDTTGASIQQIFITKRNGSTSTYSTKKDSNGNIQSLSNIEIDLTVDPKVTEYNYVSKSLIFSNISNYKYQLFYSSWETDTFMHLIELDPNANSGKNIKSFFYNNNAASMKYVDVTNTFIPPYDSTAGSIEDTNNGKTYIDKLYKDAKIYQVTKYIKYDYARGLLLILNPQTNTYNIYNRSTGTLITNNTTNIDNLDTFVSWIIPDNNNGMVVIMATALKTVVMTITSDSNHQYKLTNCVRFTDTIVYSPNVHVVEEPIVVKTEESPCHDELSCKWYYYFKTIGNDTSVLFKNDFIRKTQIVPPVCPTCPRCPGSGVCTNCGGNGGSGTTDSSGNIIGNTAKGVVNLGKEVVGGTVNLAKDTVGGTVDLAKEVVGGTVNLAKEAVGGTVDLAKDAVGGITNSSSNTSTNASQFGYVPSSGSTPVDQYSYYGALQSKGGNYMPVTADFSSFRR